MKIVSTISRYLLGLVFLVFGLNHYLNFIPTGPCPRESQANSLAAGATQYIRWSHSLKWCPASCFSLTAMFHSASPCWPQSCQHPPRDDSYDPKRPAHPHRLRRSSGFSSSCRPLRLHRHLPAARRRLKGWIA